MKRVPNAEFSAQHWRIHEIAPDFTVEDVWTMPMPGGGPEDFEKVLAAIKAYGGLSAIGRSGVTGLLFAARWRLGRVLGWDRPDHGIDRRSASLRERLPTDLREARVEPSADGSPFNEVFATDHEAAREIANQTVHAVMHLGWVRRSGGNHDLQLAVLVHPNGLLGRVYMLAITPFRHLIVYPQLGRTWQQAWLTARSSAAM